MVEALLDGRIGEALYYNPFLFVLFLLTAAFLLFMLLRTFRKAVEAACSEQQCGLVASGTFIRGGFFLFAQYGLVSAVVLLKRSMCMQQEWVRQLLAWYKENARPLPWRDTPDPYRVWVSEVMRSRPASKR